MVKTSKTAFHVHLPSLMVMDEGGRVVWYEGETGQQIRECSHDLGAPTGLGSHGGKLYAANDSQLLYWEEGKWHDFYEAAVNHLEVKAGLLAHGGNELDLHVHHLDRSAGALSMGVGVHQRPILRVGIHPQGSMVASCDADGRLVVWRVGGTGPLEQLRSFEGVRSFAWTSDHLLVDKACYSISDWTCGEGEEALAPFSCSIQSPKENCYASWRDPELLRCRPGGHVLDRLTCPRPSHVGISHGRLFLLGLDGSLTLYATSMDNDKRMSKASPPKATKRARFIDDEAEAMHDLEDEHGMDEDDEDHGMDEDDEDHGMDEDDVHDTEEDDHDAEEDAHDAEEDADDIEDHGMEEDGSDRMRGVKPRFFQPGATPVGQDGQCYLVWNGVGVITARHDPANALENSYTIEWHNREAQRPLLFSDDRRFSLGALAHTCAVLANAQEVLVHRQANELEGRQQWHVRLPEPAVLCAAADELVWVISEGGLIRAWTVEGVPCLLAMTPGRVISALGHGRDELLLLDEGGRVHHWRYPSRSLQTISLVREPSAALPPAARLTLTWWSWEKGEGEGEERLVAWLGEDRLLLGLFGPAWMVLHQAQTTLWPLSLTGKGELLAIEGVEVPACAPRPPVSLVSLQLPLVAPVSVAGHPASTILLPTLLPTIAHGGGKKGKTQADKSCLHLCQQAIQEERPARALHWTRWLYGEAKARLMAVQLATHHGQMALANAIEAEMEVAEGEKSGEEKEKEKAVRMERQKENRVLPDWEQMVHGNKTILPTSKRSGEPQGENTASPAKRLVHENLEPVAPSDLASVLSALKQS